MSDSINAFVPGPRVHIDGIPGGPLSGLSFAAKDLFDVAGVPTGGGNHDCARANPLPTKHAWAVRTLLDAGAGGNIAYGERAARLFRARREATRGAQPGAKGDATG